MLTVDNGEGGFLAVDYVIKLFYFYPLYQFDNRKLNFALILAAGPETRSARYKTIFRLNLFDYYKVPT